MKNVSLIWLLCIKLIHLSLVKGFIEEINPFPDGGGIPGIDFGDIPYINQIPNIVSQVNNIPSIVSQVNNIPSIVSQANNIPSIISQVTNIPTVLNTANTIKGLTDEIPLIGDTLDTVQDLAEKIPDIASNILKIKDVLQVFVSNPIDIAGGLGNEVESLANTLEICINQLTELVDPKQAFDSVLDITGIDLNIIGGIPDIPQLTYKVLAFMLLPMQPAIEFACDKVLPAGISMLKTAVQRIIGRRRRMSGQIPLEKDRCPDINFLCASEHISYFYDDTSNDMYRLMVDGFVDGESDLIPNPRDNSDTEVAQEIRIARFTFQLVHTIVDDLCGALDQCIPDEVSAAIYCADGINCGIVKVIVAIINDVLDYVLGSADLQDGEINNFRLKAIFNDRISIIHNQKLILNTLKGGVLGTINQIQNSANTQIYSLKKISQQIEDLNCGTAAAANSENGKFVMEGIKEKEGEIMIIKLKSIHLYYGIIIFMSCCVFCIIFGMIIGKFCCNGYKSNVGFAPVPKYDYSTTDIDDENK